MEHVERGHAARGLMMLGVDPFHAGASAELGDVGSPEGNVLDVHSVNWSGAIGSGLPSGTHGAIRHDSARDRAERARNRGTA